MGKVWFLERKQTPHGIGTETTGPLSGIHPEEPRSRYRSWLVESVDG